MVALQKADTNLDELVNDVNNLVNCTHCHGPFFPFFFLFCICVCVWGGGGAFFSSSFFFFFSFFLLLLLRTLP